MYHSLGSNLISLSIWQCYYYYYYYCSGKEPKSVISKARRSLLRLIQSDVNTNADGNADDSDIVFTGCGTESNNLAIRLSLLSSQHKADDKGVLHVISTNVEHPASE